MNPDNIDDLVQQYTAYMNQMLKAEKLRNTPPVIETPVQNEVDILKAKYRSATEQVHLTQNKVLSYQKTLHTVLSKMFLSVGYDSVDAVTMVRNIDNLTLQNKTEEITNILGDTVGFYIFKLAEINTELKERIQQLDEDLENAYAEIDELKGE